MLGLEIPRQSQAVNLGWLLLVLGLGLTEASCCLFERAIHMEKQHGLACKLVGVEPLGISKVGQTLLARMMESHQLASSVGRGFRKRTMASACLDAKHFSFSPYATGAFHTATSVLELRGSESE